MGCAKDNFEVEAGASNSGSKLFADTIESQVKNGKSKYQGSYLLLAWFPRIDVAEIT